MCGHAAGIKIGRIPGSSCRPDKYSGFLVVLISVGLAQARPNYYQDVSWYKLLPSLTSGGLLLPSCMLQRDESSNKLWCTRPFLYASLGVLRSEYLIMLIKVSRIWHIIRYDGL